MWWRGMSISNGWSKIHQIMFCQVTSLSVKGFMHVCMQLLTRNKKSPKCCNCDSYQFNSCEYFKNKSIIKAEMFLSIVNRKWKGECRNQSKNGKAKEWVIITYSFIILLNSSVLGVRLFDNGRKRAWFINGEYDEESTVCGVFPCFCECKLYFGLFTLV